MAAKSALRWAGLLLGLFVFGLLLWRLHAHWHEVSLASVQLRAWPVAFSFLLYFLAQAAFALSWHGLLHARGETGQFASDTARWSVSVAGKYFPGKVWHGVARYGLYHGAARGDRVAPGYVREQLLMLSAGMALVATIEPIWVRWTRPSIGAIVDISATTSGSAPLALKHSSSSERVAK